ncbi:MAG: heme-binding protein [Pseudomonadota bacterium]
MSKLTLAAAESIIDGALLVAAEMGLQPMTVAVLDDGGHLKAFRRQDGPGAGLRPQVAIGKAFAAVGMGARGSRFWESTAAERPHFVAGLIGISDGRFIPGRGGVIVLDDDGHVLGAVGVSGDLPDNDEQIAVAGIKSAGLRYDTGE